MVQQGSREIITDYKKAYEESKSKIEAYEKRLEETEHLLQEYEKRLPKLKELTKLSRVPTARTLKYNIYSDFYRQDPRPRRKGQQNRDEILEYLARAFPNRQSNSDLRKSTGLSRWAVQRQCKVLKQGGLVDQDKGKFGKYHLTPLALGATNLQGHWLEEIAYDSLISRYTSPNSTIREKLSALVVTLGIYNTYIMIQSALDEDFHPFIGTKISGIQRIYNILKSRQKPEMGNVVKTRIEGAIHPMQMLLQLCRLVISKEKINRYGSATTSNTPTTPSEFIASGSLFEENKTAFEDLKKAFTDLYLEDFRQLEGIRKEQAPSTAWSHLKAKYRKHRKTASTRH